MRLPELRNADELTALVNEIGFLPLFRSPIERFSVEDITSPGIWFKEGVVGPWEWRETVAAEGKIAYAKLFKGKAGFVSMEMYPHLANYRRNGYDFDARVEDGLVRDGTRRLYGLISSGITMSSDLRKGFAAKGFESALTELQMLTYVTIAGFNRKRDKHGKPYGWSIGCYRLSEDCFGAETCQSAYEIEPEQSFEILTARLRSIVPDADPMALLGY